MPLEFYGTLSVSVARMGAAHNKSHLIADVASDLNAEFDRVFVWSDRASSFRRRCLYKFYSISFFLIASVIAVAFYAVT